MYNFSIFIDDVVACEFEEKVRVCSEFYINNMELGDTFDGRDFSELTGEDIERYRNILINNNKKIVLLNTSVPITEVETYKKILRKANLLNIENIRVDIGDLDDRENVVENFTLIGKIGKSYGIRILLENISGTCVSSEENITGIFKKSGEGCTGLIFNPLEFARLKLHPFFNVFYNSKVKGDIRFLRVNDGLFKDGSPALPGLGNSEIKEIVSILLARGYSGYFSYIPYFKDMRLDTYREVFLRFKALLKSL